MNMRVASSFLVLVIAVIAALPSFVLAAPYCINISYSGDTYEPVQSALGPEFCPAGCNAAIGTCNISNGQSGMAFEVFVVIFLVATAMLGLSFHRGPGIDDDGTTHTGSLGFPMLAMVLYFTLAFASFNMQYISAGGVLPYGTDIILVLTCFILVIIAFFTLLWNIFHTWKGGK